MNAHCTHTHTHTGLTAVPTYRVLITFFHVNLGLLSQGEHCPYIMFNTIPPCPSETGEGLRKRIGRENTFHEG